VPEKNEAPPNTSSQVLLFGSSGLNQSMPALFITFYHNLTLQAKRVCAYARVLAASEAQGDSLENQTTYYRQLIENNPEYEFAGIFADYGTTGAKDDRLEFQKILALAREHKIDHILTKSI